MAAHDGGGELFDLFVEGPAHRSSRRGSGRETGRESAAQVGADQPYGVSAHVNPDLIEAIEHYRRGTERRGALRDEGGPRGRRGKARGRALDEATFGGGGGRRTRSRGDARDGGGTSSRRGSATSALSSRSSDVRGDPPPRRGPVASRAEVIDRLDREGLLPAITFIFSRVGCDAAVQQLLASGTHLIPDSQAASIRRLVEERVAGLAAEDLDVLGYWDFLDGLTRGFAAHHAGMLPTFREIVEELFTAGRIRAVFATETLALGINMPARSVVLEKLIKFNGETHAEVTPAEYTQLTGRAGRRGVDIEGHAVVLWNGRLDPIAVGAWPRLGPTRCVAAFDPTPTWPSTWWPPSAANTPGRCWRRASLSSRPTAPSWA